MESLALRFDLRVCRLTAIKKAAYKFSDRFCIQIECTGGEDVQLILSPKGPVSDLTKIEGEFRTEVLDQDLREIVAEKTETVRNLLLAHAFSKVASIDPELETADFRSAAVVAVLPLKSDAR